MDLDQIVTAIKGLKSPQSDVLLFKFRPIDSRLDKLLLGKEIYFSPPEKLNDPFDCQHDLLGSLRRAIARKDAQRPDLLETLLAHEEELRKIERAAEASGVCAFSTNLTNPLLWSHYAAGGQGCCVIYRFPQQFFSNIPDVLGLEDVVYDNSGLSRWLWMEAHRYIPDGANNPISLKCLFAKLQTKILSTKGKSWSYEEETRIIRSKSGSLPIDPAFIAAVCFGMKTPEKIIRRVIQKACQGGLNCSYFKIAKTDTDFGLGVSSVEGMQLNDVDLEQRISGMSPYFSLHELIRRDMARESMPKEDRC